MSPRLTRCTVLVAHIPPHATNEQVRFHLSRAGVIQYLSELSCSDGYGNYLYCHYRFPGNAAHAVHTLDGQPFLSGRLRILPASLRPPPPGTVPVPMASLIPSPEDVLRTASPLPILHPPTPRPLPIPTPPHPTSHLPSPHTPFPHPPPSIPYAQPQPPPPATSPPLHAFSAVPRPALQPQPTLISPPHTHSLAFPPQPPILHSITRQATPLSSPLPVAPPVAVPQIPLDTPSPGITRPVPSYYVPPAVSHLPTGYVQPPRISPFFGDVSSKGHGVDFDSWKFEVESLLRDGTYPEQILAPHVRQSIRGEPSRLIQTLGPHASIAAIILELEGSYGTVQDGPTLLQKAYNSHQEDQETAAGFGRRLKLLVFEACRRDGLPAASMDVVLRQIFWRGLRDQQLKNICRHRKDEAHTFDHLVRLVRMGEQELVVIKRQPKELPTVPPRTPDPNLKDALATIASSLADLKVGFAASTHQPLPPPPPRVNSFPMVSSHPPRSTPIECFKCGQTGHISRGCRNPPKRPKQSHLQLNSNLSPQGVMWQAAVPLAPAASTTPPMS